MDDEKLANGLKFIRSLLVGHDGFLSFDESCVEDSIKGFHSLLNSYLEGKGLALSEDEPGAASSCGHIFEHGDVIYRCKDCTHDETCVLCSKCFNDDDHVGHRISFSVSKGSGGSCDCGEDESWNRPLHCPLHQHKPEMSSESSEINDALLNFFRHLLDELVPSIVAPYLDLKIDMNASEDEVVSLVLFNDEKHSYEDVITILHHSTMLSGHPAGERTPEHYAKTIDHYGIASLGEDKGRNLMAAAATIRSVGLQVEAFSLKDVRAWIFAHYFVSWLEAAVEAQSALRGPLIQTLIESNDDQQSHLTEVLSADHYLSKGLRKAFNAILVKCALSDAATKQSVGLLYGACFPEMLEAYLEGDREPEHSLVHFSVQLFTVSSIITSLVMESRFYEEMCSIAGTYFQAAPNIIEQLPKSMISDIAMLLTVFRYVLKDPSIRKAGFFSDPVNFLHFADAFLEPLEGINPQKRQLNTHVLFESRKWTTSFTVQIQVCEVLFLYLDSIDDRDTVEKIIELLIEEYKPYSAEPSLHSMLVTAVSFLFRKVFQLSESQSMAIDFVKTLVCKSSFVNFFKTSVKMIQFSVEIESGLWVRNGLSMSSQLHLFKFSPYRFYFWDAAICCLKASLICTSFDSWLELVHSLWPLELTESSTIEPIVFEFSRFLISTLYGVSFTWIVDEKLVAEAIGALLFSGPYSFSDLEQLLPEQWVTLDCFTSYLAKYSKEKAGDKLGDHVFDIDRSHFDRFCPFYFLYSPEIRENAMERFSDESSANDTFVLSFHSSSPLSMNELSLITFQPVSEVVLKIIRRLLGSEVKSQLSLGLALACLALPRDNLIPFVATAFKDITDYSRRYIRSQLNQIEGLSAAQLYLTLFESISATKDMASSEAKRRALERINKARKGFLEASVPLDASLSLDASDADDEHVSSKSFDTGLRNSCCVICQAPIDMKSPIGMLGFLRRSHINGCTFLFSSCMHVMHLGCFKNSLASAKVAACPLCSTVSNFYLAAEGIKLVGIDSTAQCVSVESLDDLVNWIKSGSLDLLCRRNHGNIFQTKEIENYQYSFNTFMAALQAQGLKTDFTAARLIEDLVVRLKSLEACNSEFAHNLESVRYLFRTVKNWIALDVSSSLSCEIKSLVDAFCDSGSRENQISLPVALSCLLLSSDEDSSYLANSLRLCRFAYCITLRNMALEGFVTKDMGGSEEIVLDLLGNIYHSMIIWFDFPVIPAQDIPQLTKILGLPLLTSSLVQDLLLDVKTVFGRFSTPLKIISRPAFTFFSLEERYDKLLVKYSLNCCAVCKQRPLSPALCLLCGTLLCSNSLCCFDGDRGECNSHILRCGRNGGMFLLLRKNSVLLLGSPQFSWGRTFNSPYLDENGQTDPGLRRGKVLKLDRKRLEYIQKKWLSSAFDSEIYRSDDHLSIDWTSF